MRTRDVFLFLSFLLIPAGIAAVGAAPDEATAKDPGTSRFRMEVWRQDLPPGADASPMTLADLGLESGPAIRPAAEGPRAAGWIGAVPLYPAVLEAVAGLPGAKAVFRLETEARPGDQAAMVAKREFPVRSVDIRGNQTIQTTKFQRTGATAVVTRRNDAGDACRMDVEFSAVSSVVPGQGPVIFEAKMQGTLTLPDGYAAVFSFTDRGDGRIVGKDGDRVVRYLVLLSRLDLTE